MNPNNPDHLRRLVRAHAESRRLLEPFRTDRYHAIKQYAGMHYGNAGCDQKVMLNLIYLMANTYVRKLASRAPRVMITTKYAALKPSAHAMQVWANDRIKTSGLEWTLRRVVLEALFGLGICKTGVSGVARLRGEGWTHIYGEPYCDYIDFDDWVHDVHARRWDQVAFLGNRYRLPLEAVRLDDSFERGRTRDLQPTPLSAHNEQGDVRVETIGRGEESHPEEYEDYVELWDLWLPREQMMITCASGGGTEGMLEQKPLRVEEWKGPQHGPYHLLAYADVPGNLMPTAPVQQLIDLHETANALWRKLDRQARRQKTILGVQGGADADAQRVTNASDGDAVRIDQPDRVKEFRTGGPDQANFAFAHAVREAFSWKAGNLDSLAGLSPQAETLGQDQMLRASSSELVQEMQDRTVAFVRGVLRDMCQYWWEDPIQEYVPPIEAPGLPSPLPERVLDTFTITPEQRARHRFLDLNFDIDVYSMQNQTPAGRLQSMTALLQQIILPASQQLSEQGVAVSWESVLRKMAELMNMPDLEDILIFQESGPREGEGPYDEAPRKPAVSTRNYVRRGAPGMSREGGDRQMAMEFMRMAGAQQPAVREPA